MTISVRAVLSGLAVAFTAYLAVGALLWTGPVEQPIVLVATVALYLLTTWLCIFWNDRPAATRERITGELAGGTLLPPWAAVLALVVAAIVPTATWFAVGPDGRLADYATWSQGGVGALMTIVMVRRRPWSAWSGVALLAVAAIAWIGVPSALALGLVGAIVWVGIAQLLTWLVDRAARDTEQLTGLQLAASEWLATQEGMRRERRTLVQRALAVAGPVLAHTISVAGRLDEDDRQQARIAEGTLRDELRGAALLDDGVRDALAAARTRGAVVSVLDEGGLEGLTPHERATLRERLAAVLTDAASEQLYIRASRHADIAVTVVGRSAGDDGEDTVDLWHELPRHPEPGALDAS